MDSMPEVYPLVHCDAVFCCPINNKITGEKKMKKFTQVLLIIALLVIPILAFSGMDVPDTVKDVLLQYIEDQATRLYIVSDESTPTDVSGSLGYVTIDSGDFTIADGDTSGRKTTIAAQEITTTGAGTARHWVLTDETPTIIDIGTITPKVVESAAVYEFATVNLTEVRDAQ